MYSKEMRHISREVTVKKLMIACIKSAPPSPESLPKRQPIQFLKPFWQEAFPSPFFLNPSFSWGGRAEGTQSMQMLTFHNESCAHIRSEWSPL